MISEISATIISDLKPKTDLINSQVGFNIPTQLSQIYAVLKNDVMRACTPQFTYNNISCPVSVDPTNTRFFDPINLGVVSTCFGEGRNLKILTPVKVVNFPSFIPGPTKSDVCILHPSFGLSSTVWGYTHMIVDGKCNDLEHVDQYFAVGKIADQGGDVPHLETTVSWFMNDGLSRKYCSVLAGLESVWLGCSLSTEDRVQDYKTPGISKLSLAYMDVYGRKKEWIYDQDEIEFDNEYTALYFSLGSGLMRGGKGYFLVEGGLLTPYPGDVWCEPIGCTVYARRACNEATMPLLYGERQMVNGILEFDLIYDTKPKLKVRTLSPQTNPRGSKGRLISVGEDKPAYIYLENDNWYRYPYVGIINFEPDPRVTWTPISAVAAAGPGECKSQNRCPNSCTGGIYQDIFPLGKRFELGVTLMVDGIGTYTNPSIQVFNKTQVLYKSYITKKGQTMKSSTTTCFVFKYRIWCLSIADLGDPSTGLMAPAPFLYHLNLACTNYDRSHGVPIMDPSYPYLGGTPRPTVTDCYIQKNKGKDFVVLSIRGETHAYEIIWKKGLDNSTLDRELASICPDILDDLPERDTPDLTIKEFTMENATVVPTTALPLSKSGYVIPIKVKSTIPTARTTVIVEGNQTHVSKKPIHGTTHPHIVTNQVIKDTRPTPGSYRNTLNPGSRERRDSAVGPTPRPQEENVNATTNQRDVVRNPGETRMLTWRERYWPYIGKVWN
uniref:Hemagglutinin-neuraminidase n=1 Tax=Dendromus rat paramyxovirus TaxID=3141873 RepID=A0AAU7E4S9_9MONO